MNKKVFKQFFRKIRKFFAVFGVFLVFLSILPTTNVSADNDAIGLGNFLPACQATSTGVPSLMECISQITYQVLLLGVVTFFARSAYLAIISLTSGNAVKYVMESVGSLFVGIIFIGLPVAIMGMINPLSETLSIRFFQEFNLGPDAQLEDVSPNNQLSGCVGFNVCLQRCRESPGNIKTCVQNCKDNFEEKCDQKCIELIDDVGNIKGFGRTKKVNVQEYQKCINPTPPPPPPTSLPTPPSSSGFSSSINPGGFPENMPNHLTKESCKAFDKCMADTGAGKLSAEPYSCRNGNGSCMRAIGTCIKNNSGCDCAKKENFTAESSFDQGDNKAFKGPTNINSFIKCMEGS